MPAGSAHPRHRDLFARVRVIWRATLASAEAAIPATADAVMITWAPDSTPAAPALARLRERAPLLLLRCVGETAALRAAVAAGCHGIVLADCAGAAALQRASARLAVHEAEQDRAAGATALVAEVGARGLLALPGLVGSTDRLAALFWHPAALAAACGGDADAFTVGPAGAALRPWLVVAATAAAVPAYDAAAPAPPAARAAQARASRAIGFAGTVSEAADDCAVLASAWGRDLR